MQLALLQTAKEPFKRDTRARKGEVDEFLQVVSSREGFLASEREDDDIGRGNVRGDTAATILTFSLIRGGLLTIMMMTRSTELRPG